MNAARSAREVVAALAPASLLKWVRRAVEHATFPVDMTSEDIALFRRVAPFTMTSPERVIALRDAVLYLSQLGVAGDFVECGVWRGGSMMVVAEALAARGDLRRLHLFDTFEGMSAPGEHDASHAGEAAADVLANVPRRAGRTLWCIADEEDVRRNLTSTGYPMELVRLVRGKVEQTLPAAAPEQIALLRLDTDWYESTRHELEHLYPRVVPGGIIIIDDYGYWRGARKAVDEYLSSLERRPLLSRVDSTGRLIIKP